MHLPRAIWGEYVSSNPTAERKFFPASLYRGTPTFSVCYSLAKLQPHFKSVRALSSAALLVIVVFCPDGMILLCGPNHSLRRVLQPLLPHFAIQLCK